MEKDWNVTSSCHGPIVALVSLANVVWHKAGNLGMSGATWQDWGVQQRRDRFGFHNCSQTKQLLTGFIQMCTKISPHPADRRLQDWNGN